MLSIQWEMRFDRSFASDLNGFMNHKGIRFDDEGKRGSKDARYVEYQFRYSQTDDTAVAFPTLRLYSASAGGEGSLNPLRGLLKPMDPTFGVYDEQPGGRTAGPNKMNYGAKHHMQPPWNTFLLLPDRWIRVTSIIDFRKGEARIRTIMSDEQTNPVVVFDDPENPGDGFLADRDPSYINAIRVEFNSSQTVEFDKPKYIWVRNFIAAVDVELDHGGRPVSSTCRSR